MNAEQIVPIILCMSISLVGAFVQRVSGFGYGIIVMMVFPYLLAYSEATALSSIISLISSAYVAFTMRKNIRFSKLFVPLITYTVTSYLATGLVTMLDTSLLKRILGVALVVLSIYFFFFNSKLKIRPTLWAALVAGGVSGAMSGLLSMGGPPMVLYFMSTNSESTDDYVATIQAFFAVSNVIVTGIRVSKGLVTDNVLLMILPVAAAMLVGTLCGQALYKRLSPPLIKKCVYAFMAVSGVIAIFTA